jgi:hypothetical protein
MITDLIPRSIPKRAEYERSDKMGALSLPGESRLPALAHEIESAMFSESKPQVRIACNDFLRELADLLKVPLPSIRVLDARPLRVYEAGSAELFGDYQLGTALIRVWMRTAVQKRVTSFGTFLNTLCHEFCHHFDILRLELPNSFHTRGFYQRTAVLYHHCKGTPFRPLVWRKMSNNRWAIDWSRMNRNRS